MILFGAYMCGNNLLSAHKCIKQWNVMCRRTLFNFSPQYDHPLVQEDTLTARQEEVKQVVTRQKEIEQEIMKCKPKQHGQQKSLRQQLKKISRSMSRLTARIEKILPDQRKGRLRNAECLVCNSLEHSRY